jgi:hypothetical protein
MAIQPVDLQLAYLAAPASAAVVNSAQVAPEAAQQAAQAAFAAHVEQREETVAEATDVEGAKIHADSDGGGNAGEYAPRQRRRNVYGGQFDEEDSAQASDGSGEHFIDTTA